MATVMIIAHDPKESVLLRQVFLKLSINVVTCLPTYASYLKTLQYAPDVVLMEMSANSKMHLNFLKVIRSNKGIAQIPFVLFGPEQDPRVCEFLGALGLTTYFKRPFDIKEMIKAAFALIQAKKQKKKAEINKNQVADEELKKLLSKSVSVPAKLDIMAAHIENLLAFPATVAAILKISQDEKSGAYDLAQVIKSDPSVSTEILKVANSVHFGRGGKRLVEIKDAVVRIGFLQTKSVAMSLSVFKIMQDKNYATGFNHTEFWLHAVGVAIIAEKLAKSSRLVSPDQAFMAGLVHDLGIMLYNEYFNAIFLDMLDTTTTDGVRFSDCQMEKVGFTHNQLVARMLSAWNFPEEFVADIEYFCMASILNEKALAERPTAVIVTVADIIAKSLVIGREADCCVDPIPAGVLERLGMPYGLLKEFVASVFDEINVFNGILHIDKNLFPIVNDSIIDAPTVQLLCYSFSSEQYNPVITYLQSHRYSVTLAKSLDDFYHSEKKFHLYVLTDASNAVIGDIGQLASLKTMLYAKDKEEAVLHDAKMMLFDTKKEIDTTLLGENSVVSCFPVDLRAIDMVLACMIYDQPLISPHNKFGAFKPMRTITVGGAPVDMRTILIVNDHSSFQKQCTQVVASAPTYRVEIANDGLKAQNLAKTATREIALVIIDVHIPIVSCAEVVKSIKMLPGHKRAKYLITFESAEKSELLPLVSLGVTSFIREKITDQDLGLKIMGLLNLPSQSNA